MNMIEKNIKESLLDIQKQYIQNATNPKFKWVGLHSKIELLYGIAKETLNSGHELLTEIALAKAVITGKR
jgi:hypothetical protein